MKVLIDDRRAIYAPYTGIGRFAGQVTAALERFAPQVNLVRASSRTGPLARSGIASSAWAGKFATDQIVLPLRSSGVDLYHAVYHEASPILRVPLVLSVHDLSIWQEPDHFSRVQRGYYGSLLSLLMRQARIVVVPSEVTRSELSRYSINAPVRVMPYPLDPAFTAEVRAGDVGAVLRRFGLERRQFLLYTGGLHARKDLDTLLRGVAQAQVRAPGIGPLFVTGPRSSAFEAKAREIGCEVLCSGTLSTRETRMLYDGCSVVVNASVNEGFGYPAAEGAAVGRPVVCPDRGSLPEAAGGAAVPFRAGDASALAEAVLSATLLDVGARQALAFERRRAVARFSLRAAAEELWICYQLALRGDARHRGPHGNRRRPPDE